MATRNSALSRSAPTRWGVTSRPAAGPAGLCGCLCVSPASALSKVAPDPTHTLLTREHARTTERAAPVVSLKAAAGAFSAAQSLEDKADRWVQLTEGLAAAPALFVAQVIGESMNHRIPSGACCLFRAAPSGSRQGRIMRGQHRDVTGPETGGSYTVKRYQSEKQGDGEAGGTSASR